MTANTGTRPEKPREVDLLVRNAYLVTMDSGRRVFVDGAVAVKGGSIVAVGPDREVAPAVAAARIIDGRGAVLHPGFIDTHVHLLYHNIRWACDDGAGWDDAMPIHGAYGRLVDDDITHTGAKLAALEMARNGTTCCLDAGGVARSDAAAAAVEEIGIRALLGGPRVRDITPEGTVNPADREDAFRNLGIELRRNSDPNVLVRGVVTVSGMGSASDELLLAAKAMADEHGVILNQHQSYQRLDTDEYTARLGRPPLVHFAEIGLLGRNCTFSHVNILVDDEVPAVLKSGMSVVWCPIASMLYGVGGTIHGRHLELHKQGANIALGCDSANWTSAFDIGEQAFIALLTAREKTGRADALIAEEVLEMATINGARAVGMADKLGSIEIGKRADMVLRSQDMPETLPGLDPLRSVIYSSRSKSVDTVIVNGEVVVEHGRSARVDEEEFYALSRETSRKLLKRLGLRSPQGRWPRVV